MKIGLQTLFTGDQKQDLASYIIAFGQAAEERGFAGIWTGEHVVVFGTYDPAFPYPYAEGGSPPTLLKGAVDPLSVLLVLATHTRRLTLGTGVAILPQRNPVYFARMGSDIDCLSNGRFRAGVGLGWSGQEFAALGVPFERRGSRMDEYVQVVRSLWCDEVSRFEGRFYSLPACIQKPKPVRRPHPPFYFGGESPAALRRVARFGQGWLGFRLTPDALSGRLEQLDLFLADAGRTRGEIDVVISPGDLACDADMLARYAELGVSQVTCRVVSQDVDDVRRQLDRFAETMLLPAARL